MPQGHPEDYAPEELQHGVSEFARVFGREPATDSEMDMVSRIIAGEDPETLAAEEGDPSDPESEYAGSRNDRLGRPLEGAGDPNIGRADQSYKHRSEGPNGPARGTPAYAQGKPKLRIAGGEDDLPETDSFDYSGDVDAEPRVDQPMLGSPQALMQMMQQSDPRGERGPWGTMQQGPMNPADIGGPNDTGPEPQFGPPMPGGQMDPRLGPPGSVQQPQGQNVIQQLLQAIMGGMAGR